MLDLYRIFPHPLSPPAPAGDPMPVGRRNSEEKTRKEEPRKCIQTRTPYSKPACNPALYESRAADVPPLRRTPLSPSILRLESH